MNNKLLLSDAPLLVYPRPWYQWHIPTSSELITGIIRWSSPTWSAGTGRARVVQNTYAEIPISN